MRIVPPVSVSDSNLTFCNIPEDDADAWSSATDYSLGDLVMDDHIVYESILGTGNIDKKPSLNEDTFWLKLGATNKYKAFDNRLSDKATYDDELVYTIAHAGEFVSAVAVFGLTGGTMRVQVVDPDAGTVFDETYMLLDDSGVIDWNTYFFSPVGVQRQEVLEINIPPYLNASTTVTVTNTGGQAKVGQIVLGRVFDLGITEFNTTLSIEDYSRKERLFDGSAVIVERAYSQLIDYDVKYRTETTRRLQTTLAKYRATPVVWIGTEKEEYGTIVFGYFRRFDLVIASPKLSDASIEVEGLI